MFVLSNEKTKVPIKIWLEKESDISESCLDQAYNVANLPFIHKWVSLMPDTHVGMSMPIGGVMATDGVVVPNAVGSYIGCGMSFCQTNIKLEQIKDIKTPNGSMIQGMIGDILRNVPVGKNRYKKIQESSSLDKAHEEIDKYENNIDLLENLELGYYQVGTLGGGNHFIELQVDNEGFICIMLHSGSRNFGKKVCDYFDNTAKILNQKYYSGVPEINRLAFLPTDSKEGIEYINWMQLSLDFAYENRERMMFYVKNTFEKWIKKHTDFSVEYFTEINCHHNYAALEHHYSKDVWVHRKGAIRAKNGELAVIPGAMGSYSYVVMGKGNEMSFCSSSHGAGRKHSRTSAMSNFTTDEVLNDLREKGIVLGKNKKSDVAEESRFAYKDIDEVMSNQNDLVVPVKRLMTIGVVKG